MASGNTILSPKLSNGKKVTWTNYHYLVPRDGWLALIAGKPDKTGSSGNGQILIRLGGVDFGAATGYDTGMNTAIVPVYKGDDVELRSGTGANYCLFIG